MSWAEAEKEIGSVFIGEWNLIIATLPLRVMWSVRQRV